MSDIYARPIRMTMKEFQDEKAKTPAKKPRIKRITGVHGAKWWECSGGFYNGCYQATFTGFTPIEAYEKWRSWFQEKIHA